MNYDEKLPEVPEIYVGTVLVSRIISSVLLSVLREDGLLFQRI